MARTVKILVITDAAGNIVGGAHFGNATQKGMNAAVRPLAGQRLHEVEIPAELAQLRSGHLLHQALSAATWSSSPASLKFPKTRYTRKKHD